ncbi:TPA: hypothetical protein IAA86_01995 [Candidatus Galligastranaerophilus intestinavium]|uniref:Alpha/beta hydrolase n=1 Tax=Candidatus Galligastranaerophilus intestinavium TaxID=2840836 RepID=A0A9D1JX51_9BACT|nr:hypothetical protein [Candidatus Galligastranaerophilus intestinavium]
MRKFLLFILLFASLTNTCYAQGKINFIYINGSNTNDEKQKNWFFSGVEKFHPIFVKKILGDDFMSKNLAQEGKYTISNEPNYLFWGDLTKYEIERLNKDINILKRTSPRLAQFTRRFISMCFHDAIWISKFPNMMPVLDMLQEQILEADKNGDKVVLMGYSAGTFVTYQYFLTKLPVIEIKKIVEQLNVTGKQDEFDKSTKCKNTCLDALFRADILTYNLTGRLVANPNDNLLKQGLANIDNYTDKYCAPKDTIKGVVNYASPIALFYSDLADPKYKTEQISTLAYKYLIENNIFFLNVNYADDPLGIPVSKNLTFEETKNITNLPIAKGGGFYYDKSDIASPRPFFLAHTSYWATAKKFSDTIIKAYNEGYSYFYNY